MEPPQMPPKLFHRFFRWYCHPRLVDHIEGDLLEEYGKRLQRYGKRKADLKFIIDVLLLFRRGIIRPRNKFTEVNQYAMYRSYFKIGWRNLWRNKGYAAINIGGLALGMSVTLLIGLWIYDELSFNKYHKNYDRIARVLFHGTEKNEKWTSDWIPIPLGPELKKSFGDDFEHVVMSTYPQDRIISFEDKKFGLKGQFMDTGAAEMLTLEMASGTRAGLKDMNSILLSESSARWR